jgi:hypothetical protein
MRYLLLLIEFLRLTASLGHIMDTPWSWRFPSSPTVSLGWWWVVICGCCCHRGGEWRFPLPRDSFCLVVMDEQLFLSTGRRSCHMAQFLCFSRQVWIFELYGSQNWIMMLLGLSYSILGLSLVHIPLSTRLKRGEVVMDNGRTWGITAHYSSPFLHSVSINNIGCSIYFHSSFPSFLSYLVS